MLTETPWPMLLVSALVCGAIIRESVKSPKKEKEIPEPEPELTELEKILEAKVAALPRVYHENWSNCPPHYWLKSQRMEDLNVTIRECRNCPMIEGWINQ